MCTLSIYSIYIYIHCNANIARTSMATANRQCFYSFTNAHVHSTQVLRVECDNKMWSWLCTLFFPSLSSILATFPVNAFNASPLHLAPSTNGFIALTLENAFSVWCYFNFAIGLPLKLSCHSHSLRTLMLKLTNNSLFVNKGK